MSEDILTRTPVVEKDKIAMCEPMLSTSTPNDRLQAAQLSGRYVPSNNIDEAILWTDGIYFDGVCLQKDGFELSEL